jgi:plastocyanin
MNRHLVLAAAFTTGAAISCSNNSPTVPSGSSSGTYSGSSTGSSGSGSSSGSSTGSSGSGSGSGSTTGSSGSATGSGSSTGSGSASGSATGSTGSASGSGSSTGSTGSGSGSGSTTGSTGSGSGSGSSAGSSGSTAGCAAGQGVHVPAKWDFAVSAAALNGGKGQVLSIHVCDTVDWTNDDTGIPHSVVSTGGGFTFSTPVAAGSAAGVLLGSVQFTKAGTFTYHCGVHLNMMIGQVTVQ